MESENNVVPFDQVELPAYISAYFASKGFQLRKGASGIWIGGNEFYDIYLKCNPETRLWFMKITNIEIVYYTVLEVTAVPGPNNFMQFMESSGWMCDTTSNPDPKKVCRIIYLDQGDSVVIGDSKNPEIIASGFVDSKFYKELFLSLGYTVREINNRTYIDSATNQQEPKIDLPVCQIINLISE